MRFSCPGKIFLLGEYAVLGGYPALVATLGPRFSLKEARMDESGPYEEGAGKPDFHPESPVARLMARARKPIPDFAFHDPLAGRGGLGASTAQFALVYRLIAAVEGWELSWKALWKLYRELTAPAQGTPPSGADLVAQWEGGVIRFDISTLSVERANPEFPWQDLLVFSATSQAGRKVATHHHLESLAGRKFSELEPSLRAGFGAVEAGDRRAFGAAMGAYGGALAGLGLQVDATAADRREISRLPGVLGVKGAGALQSDAVLVMMDEGFDHGPVIELARSRGLALAADGLVWEKGISE